MNVSTPTTLARVREIFASSRFGRLFATRTVSQLGDGIFQLAAADVLLFDNPGANPALTLTVLSAVTLIPFSVVSPFAGAFIDRWDRRKILEIVPAIRAALAIAVAIGLAGGSSSPVFYLVVLVVLSINRLFLATISAVLPQTVPGDDLIVANSVASTGGSVANVIGLGAGAGMSALVGGTRAAGFAAVAFIAGTMLARKLQVHRGAPPNTAPLAEDLRAVMSEIVDGVRRIGRSRRATFALSAVATNQVLIGGMTAATAVFYIRSLQLGVGAVTSLLAFLAMGLAVGVALVPVIARRIRYDRLIPVSFAIAAVAVLATSATLSRVSVVAGAVVMGLAYSMTKIPVDTIVQEEMPDSHRGRAFAAYDLLFNVARVAGTAAAAVAIEAQATPRASVFAVGLAYVAAVFWFASRERKVEPHPATPTASPLPARAIDPEPAPAGPRRPFAVGELVSVRSYEGHRSSVEPRAIVVGGQEIPVDSVDWRAVEERPGGVRRHVFVVRVAGERLRLVSSDESSRWEIERILGSSVTS